MVTKYLGARFDIHGGGLDLRFPHHENEMAQSQAAGDGFANFWMHNGMVTFEGEKMSKSIGNTVSPADMLELATPRVVRYYLGQAQYRSVLDYRPTSLQEAAAAVERIDGFISRAVRALAAADGTLLFAGHGRVPEAFEAAMDDDLNVPQALAVLHDTVRAGNAALTAGELDAARQALVSVTDMLRVLGISDAAAPARDDHAHEALAVLVEAQLEARARARASKDWPASDAIRDTLAAAGIVVEDNADGASWSLKRD
jgi:cysteinyl-tRNA synthetase